MLRDLSDSVTQCRHPLEKKVRPPAAAPPTFLWILWDGFDKFLECECSTSTKYGPRGRGLGTRFSRTVDAR